MAEPNATTTAFLGKATRYIERGVAEPAESEQHAYWLHYAIEPLLRAAVAHVHPVLLADPRSDDSVLAALGASPHQATIRSRPSSGLVKLLGLLDPQRFGPDFARRVNAFIDRRNIESHAEAAALEGLVGWRDEFLRLATVLCDFIGADPPLVLGDGLAAIAARLSARDDTAIKKQVNRLLSEAQARGVGAIANSGLTEVQYANGTVLRAFPCPACRNEAYVTGWRVTKSDPLVQGGNLVRRVTVASDSFKCDHCELHLPERPMLVVAGLPDLFETTEAVDPFDALTLDAAEEVERMGLVVVDPDWEPDYDDIGD